LVTHVLGCGSTAQHWDGLGTSIGVNDCEKYHPVNHLIVVNSPTRFKDEPDRFNTIINSKPDQFYSNAPGWEKWFPNWKKINLISFSYSHRRIKDRLWCSKTSPFVAICMAVNMGAKDIVLWGVDMLTHKYYSPGSKFFNPEYKNYLKLFEKLKAEGVNVWRGADGTCFDNDLLKYDR
jgi:hypothetical protein